MCAQLSACLPSSPGILHNRASVKKHGSPQPHDKDLGRMPPPTTLFRMPFSRPHKTFIYTGRERPQTRVPFSFKAANTSCQSHTVLRWTCWFLPDVKISKIFKENDKELLVHSMAFTVVIVLQFIS